MTPHRLTAALKEEATRLGFDLTGVAPAIAPPEFDRFRAWLSEGNGGRMDYLAGRLGAYEHPRHVLAEVRSILMLAVNYRTVEPAGAVAGQGRISRYAWSSDYHEVIRRKLHCLADFHRQAMPNAVVRGVVDTAPLMERQFARLAGLGWIGKNTLLVSQEYGSWLFLAALLSSAELEYDQPSDRGRCGSCRACLDACPTGALVDAYRLDARKCISYLTIELRERIPPELREPIGDRLFGCDACQEACPHNRSTPTTKQNDFRPGPGMNPVELADLLTVDDVEFRRRFRHTPLWRGRRQGILHNAAVVLENRPQDSALSALIQGLRDAAPRVRAACAGALGQYVGEPSRAALRRQRVQETDPTVLDEIDNAIRCQAL